MEKLERKIEAGYQKHKKDLPKIIGLGFLLLYFYGMLVHSMTVGINSTWHDGGGESLFTWNPFTNLGAVFTPTGLGLGAFLVIMYCLFTRKGYSLISGYKTIKDKERGIEILPEGTHGTSGWMDRRHMEDVVTVSPIAQTDTTLFGKLIDSSTEYIGMKQDIYGLNKNIIIYGAPGTGKSRGFVMPFVMQAVHRGENNQGESLIMIDPKAEFYEMYSSYLESHGYYVRAYNLLDLEASDGWNCLVDSADDVNLVQHVAEVIIRNTSNEQEREDFWSKAEKNLLMALIHYVQTLTYPGTDKLLPVEERSLGTIYKIISTTNVNELDARFRALPPNHPALPPYGIFRQAPHNIWGNVFIGLGSRLNVFQNKLVDSITKHNEIDLTLPGKQKCAYFCIISDQDSSLKFLSSMFFSLLFVRLFDCARQQESRRLPITVNVLMDEFCNIDVLDFKKILSTARSRNINIQCVVQSVAQLADRYPKTEWQEIVGDCDYQVMMGCNDAMTAEFWSSQCGEVTVRVNNAMVPMTPLFSPVLSTTRPYTHSKTSTGRPLMMPDEIRRLPKEQEILLIRGEKPIKLCKIRPEEHPAFDKLVHVKALNHVPEWRLHEEQQSATVAPNDQPPTYQVHIPEEQESSEYNPTEEELDLQPPPIHLGRGIDCKNLKEIPPEDL